RVDAFQRREWNRSAVSIAREAGGGEKYIVGAVGQVPDLLSIRARHTFEEHVAAISEQIRDLWAAGVDAIHLVHYADSANLKAALCALKSVEDEAGCRIPAMITFDLEPLGTLVNGERPEALCPMLRDYRPIAMGLATYGSGAVTVRRLRDATDVPVGL